MDNGKNLCNFSLVVLCIVLVAGLWLAVVQSLPNGKSPHPEGCNDDMPVSFGYCFYFLLVGGAFSLGGASINLLFARSAADRRRSLRNRFRYLSSIIGFGLLEIS